jgi:hypothetical protein
MKFSVDVGKLIYGAPLFVGDMLCSMGLESESPGRRRWKQDRTILSALAKVRGNAHERVAVADLQVGLTAYSVA